MKKLNLLFTALLLLCCVGTAKAEEVTIDDIKYDVVTKGKIATVIKGGNYSGDIVIPETIEHNGVNYSVTSIGDKAFLGCWGLTSIEIPNSVTSIEERAFEGCNKLTNVTIPNSVTSIGKTAFYGCKSFTSIEIPNSVTSIGEWAFYGCSGLKTVINYSNLRFSKDAYNSYITYYADKVINAPNGFKQDDCIWFENEGAMTLACYLGDAVELDLPAEYNGKNVTSIGNDAFKNCTRLTSIVIPNSVTSIGDKAFSGCSSLTSIEIPNSVTSIGQYAFSSCSGLTSIEIPNGVTSIGNYAFSYCPGLTSIEISNSVTSIGNYAFRGCSGLKSIVIGNSVTSIGSSAFEGCHELTNVTIPNSVTSIKNSTFYDCVSLTSITIPNSVTSIGDKAFAGCKGLKSITIPNSVTNIGTFAFGCCFGLTSIIIPNRVTSIEAEVFYECIGLTSVTIGNSVTSIGGNAFSGCSGLTSATIGSGVEYISSSAFAKCENLTDVYCLATSVPSTNATAFEESYPEYMTLHVPAEAINSYRTTAPWSSFGTIVTLNGEDIEPEVPEIPEVKVCATPAISYSDGNLHFECETEGAEFITDVTCSDIKKFYDSDINFSVTYNIAVYATATGYEKSETVNATLCWIECECDGSDDTGVISIPATAALVTSNNGALSISCQLNGEEVAVYTTAGTLIGTATIDNDTATIATDLSKGTVAIVKIGNKSIKVIVD